MTQRLITGTPAGLVAAADPAEALAAARRAKTTLCTLLFFVLGTVLTLFFLLRYVPSMRPLVAGPTPVPPDSRAAVLQYAVGLLDMAALVLPLVLVVMVGATLLVQVAAGAAGTGRTVSALGWAVLLAVLLFPWQAVLNNPAINPDPRANAIGMKLPGVVCTWAELSHPTQGATFAELNVPGTDKLAAGLHWARYALFPLLAMIVVGLVHTKTERGLRQSFGTDVVVDESGDVVASDVNPQL